MKRSEIKRNRRFNNDVLPLRRELRLRSTKPEKLMWSVLRAHRLGNLKFRRQLSIGQYIVDFACDEKKLVIEIDGAYHDYVGEEDKARENYLQQQGWTVLRFANDDVLKNLESVVLQVSKVAGVAFDG